MLLFVALRARRLPLRAPGRRGRAAPDRAPLGGDRLHGAPRADARVRRPSASSGVFDALVLAPSDRSAIWLGKASRSSPSSASPSSSRCRRSRCSSRPVGWQTVAAVALADIGICAVGTLLAAMASPAARASCCCRCSSCRSRSRSSSAGSGASVANRRPVPGLSRALRRRFYDPLAGQPSSTSSTELTGPSISVARRALPRCSARAGVALARASSDAPHDADQGFSQKIFYFHVPIALTAYACFGWGAWKALRLPVAAATRSTTSRATSRSTMGVIFGVAHAAHRLDLGEDLVGRLVELGRATSSCSSSSSSSSTAPTSCCASRSSRARSARTCRAVYALFGVVLIPVSFLAIRLASSFIHPVVFTRDGPQMTQRSSSPSASAWSAMLVLAAALYQRRARRQADRRAACASCASCSRERRPRSTSPAAYLVVLRRRARLRADHLARSSQRLDREVGELADALQEKRAEEPSARRRRLAELLFWPALLAYGEAAFAYAGTSPPGRAGAPRPGASGSAGSRRRRCSSCRRSRADGFPWATWAGSLNLFVWLVVGVYLIWGCRPRYRLLGLVVMPLAAVLLVVCAPRRRDRRAGRGRLLDPLPRRSTSASCSPRSPASRSRRRSPRSTSGRSGGCSAATPDILRSRLPSLVVARDG